jgi:hypothetical protein
LDRLIIGFGIFAENIPGRHRGVVELIANVFQEACDFASVIHSLFGQLSVVSCQLSVVILFEHSMDTQSVKQQHAVDRVKETQTGMPREIPGSNGLRAARQRITVGRLRVWYHLTATRTISDVSPAVNVLRGK